MNPASAAVTAAMVRAREGVEYDRRKGAACPYCGRKMRTTSTWPKGDGIRVRYHKCRNSRCALGRLDFSVKSVEFSCGG